jgi:predicted DNA-binding transcriptional regulator AlpA
MAKLLMDSEDICAEYGFPLPTWRYWEALGKTPKSARIGRRRLWRREDVDAWVNAHFAGGAA